MLCFQGPTGFYGQPEGPNAVYFGQITEAKPARDLDDLLEKMGAQRMMPTGFGDDQDTDRPQSQTSISISIKGYGFGCRLHFPLSIPIVVPGISTRWFVKRTQTSTTLASPSGRASCSPDSVLTRPMPPVAAMMAQ